MLGREENNEWCLKYVLEVCTRFRRLKRFRDAVSFKSGNEPLFRSMKSFKFVYPKISLNSLVTHIMSFAVTGLLSIIVLCCQANVDSTSNGLSYKQHFCCRKSGIGLKKQTPHKS